MSPVRDGLGDRPERKPIIMENYYAALNYTETLEHENDHIMVKVHLHGEKETVTINAMIDSGATEDHQQKIPFLHPEHHFLLGRDSGCIGTHLVSSKGFHTHPVNL